MPIALSSQVTISRYGLFPSLNADHAFSWCVGFERCGPDYRIERPGFPAWTMELVWSGEGTFREQGRSVALHAGSFFAFGPGIPHTFSTDPRRRLCKYFVASMDPTTPTLLAEAGIQLGVVHSLGDPEPLRSVIELLLRESASRQPETPHIASSLIDVFFAKLRVLARMARATGSQHPTVARAIEWVRREFAGVHTAAEIAAALGVSESYLCRLFRTHYWCSPYQLLLREKLGHAYLMLRGSRLSVTQVAARVGFDDPFHFSRVFRQHMGFAPSAAR
jgi:AraC family transcriptional regulator